MKIGMKLLISLACLLCFTARAQVIIPEEGGFKHPVVLMKQRGDKLYVVQAVEASNVFSLTISYKGGGSNIWRSMPSVELAKLNGKFQVTDLEIYMGRVWVSGIFGNIQNTAFNCLFSQDTGTGKMEMSYKFQAISNTSVNALAVAGKSKELWIGGNFKMFNGLAYYGLFRLNSILKPLGVDRAGKIGLETGMVTGMTTNNNRDSLWVAGTFLKIAGGLMPGLALNNTADTLGFRKVKTDSARLQNVFFHRGYLLSTQFCDSSLLLVEFRMQYPSGKVITLRKDSTFFVHNIVPFEKGFIYLAYAKYPGRIARNYLGYINPDSLHLSSIHESIAGIDKLEMYGNQYYVAGTMPILFSTNSASRVGILKFHIHRFYGRVFHDKNKSGKFDAGEVPLPGAKVSVNGRIFITDILGIFSFDFSDVTTKTFEIQVKDFKNLSIVSPLIKFRSDTFQSKLVDLPVELVKSNFSDMAVNIRSTDGWQANSDSSVSYTITVKNEGVTAGFVNVKLDYNSKLTQLRTSIAPSIINAGSLEFNNIFLKPNEERRITVQSVAPSSSIPSQSQIAFNATVSSPGGDDYNENNTDTLVQTVQPTGWGTAKFQDPQDNGSGYAQLAPTSGCVDYLIRIANSGTDTVYSAVVRDTVYAPLYITYIQETGSSHPFTRNVYQDPGNPFNIILVYTFTNLKLVPNPSGSSEIDNSTAHIGYRVGFNTSVPMGTVFINTAYVSENGNGQVGTNTVKAMVAAVSVKKIDVDNSGDVYPNPCSDRFFLKTELRGKPLQIYSTNGQLLRSFAQAPESVDMSSLNVGSYIWISRQDGLIISRGILLKN